MQPAVLSPADKRHNSITHGQENIFVSSAMLPAGKIGQWWQPETIKMQTKLESAVYQTEEEPPWQAGKPASLDDAQIWNNIRMHLINTLHRFGLQAEGLRWGKLKA